MRLSFSSRADRARPARAATASRWRTIGRLGFAIRDLGLGLTEMVNSLRMSSQSWRRLRLLRNPLLERFLHFVVLPLDDGLGSQLRKVFREFLRPLAGDDAIANLLTRLVERHRFSGRGRFELQDLIPPGVAHHRGEVADFHALD